VVSLTGLGVRIARDRLTRQRQAVSDPPSDYDGRQDDMQGTCNIDGCDRVGTIRRGLCGMHYERFRVTGTTISSRPNLGLLCAVEGCETLRGTRTHCRMHAARLLRTGSVGDIAPSRTTPSQSIRGRLLAHTRRTDTGCLEWTAYRDRNGYGRISVWGGRQLVHRVAWIDANGPIPDGMCVCHHCDNPPCCDLTHLFLGTQSDNMADMASKGRHWRTV